MRMRLAPSKDELKATREKEKAEKKLAKEEERAKKKGSTKSSFKKKKKNATRVVRKDKRVGEDRVAAIGELIGNINKKAGEGTLRRMGDFDKVGIIPSGSIGLDCALGIGGYPRGRIVEVYGPEASGKTTLTLHAIAECQKAGGVAAFVDAEHAMDLGYAAELGINVDELLFAQPDSGEQALDVVEDMVIANVVDIIVVDSVAALVPQAEIDGTMGQSHVGLQARLMSQALRKLTGAISKTNTCLIFINQIRHKIGVMFGSPETTTGGNALKFYASVRVDVRRIGALKHGDKEYGNRVRAKIKKNKLAPPHQECEFDIIWGHGINSYGDIFDLAVDYGLIDQSGAWFSYEGERIGQGRENSVKSLAESGLLDDIEAMLRKDLTGGNKKSDSDDSEDDQHGELQLHESGVESGGGVEPESEPEQDGRGDPGIGAENSGVPEGNDSPEGKGSLSIGSEQAPERA